MAKGEASAEEKKQLVELYEALAANKPPKGDEASWKEKTAALVAAAKDGGRRQGRRRREGQRHP